MTNGNSNTKDQKGASVCLACEMDRLFVSYYGSTIGKDIFAAIEEASQSLLKVKNAAEPVEPKEIEKGCPLIISDFLTATWKSGGMDHLAGYEQRDAQEFLNSFLDMLGKNIVQHRGRVYDSLTAFKADSAMIPKASKAEDGRFY